MAFQAERFRQAEWTPRTETVEIPALAGFFAEGEAPAFTVRGLTAAELQLALEAGKRQSGVEAVVKAITTQKEQVNQIRAALGLTQDTPGEVVRRIEMLVQGSVAPKLDHADAVKLAEVCPVEFFDLTNRITSLTGQGQDRLKKPETSSQMPTG
jgi:hypothetical protein